MPRFLAISMYFTRYLADTDITNIQSSQYHYRYRYPVCRYRYISIGQIYCLTDISVQPYLQRGGCVAEHRILTKPEFDYEFVCKVSLLVIAVQWSKPCLHNLWHGAPHKQCPTTCSCTAGDASSCYNTTCHAGHPYRDRDHKQIYIIQLKPSEIISIFN